MTDFIDRHFNILMAILFTILVIILSLHLYVMHQKNEIKRERIKFQQSSPLESAAPTEEPQG